MHSVKGKKGDVSWGERVLAGGGGKGRYPATFTTRITRAKMLSGRDNLAVGGSHPGEKGQKKNIKMTPKKASEGVAWGRMKPGVRLRGHDYRFSSKVDPSIVAEGS